MVSCGALAVVDAEAHRSTRDALDSLRESRQCATRTWQEKMATIAAQQQAVQNRVAAERATAAAALAHLLPLRTGRVAEHYPTQLNAIFNELEGVTDHNTRRQQENAAAQRRIQVAEAEAECR